MCLGCRELVDRMSLGTDVLFFFGGGISDFWVLICFDVFWFSKCLFWRVLKGDVDFFGFAAGVFLMTYDRLLLAAKRSYTLTSITG